MLPRVLEAETLDHLAPDDPAAERSRRDLRRVNRVMGAGRILARGLARALGDGAGRTPPARPLRLLEIGCGDGRLLLEVARRERAGPRRSVALTLLDRQPLVDAGTVAAYAVLGWQAAPLQADVLDWAAAPAGSAEGRWDAVVANLFLHHFEGGALTTLLRACAARADAVVFCEPRRSRFALAASHLVGLIGGNAVTRHDAVLSVRAGFRDDEIGAAWRAAVATDADADADAAWYLDEYDDGLFTHCLCARRLARAR